jgi:hypothetical protein
MKSSDDRLIYALLGVIIGLLSITPAYAEIAEDKKQHFIAGGLVYTVARLAGQNQWQAFGWSVAAGIAKEVYDDKPDAKDAFATALGGASLMIIEWSF